MKRDRKVKGQERKERKRNWRRPVDEQNSQLELDVGQKSQHGGEMGVMDPQTEGSARVTAEDKVRPKAKGGIRKRLHEFWTKFLLWMR